MSGSRTIWEKLTSGYHNYSLKGLNLRYMYFSQKNFLNKLKYINMISRKWCSYWYALIFINFGFKVRYMYRKIMAFFREVIFQILIRIILRQKACNQFYSWYWNSKMTAVVEKKSWLSPFVCHQQKNKRHTTPPPTHNVFIMPLSKGIGSRHKVE